METVGHPRASAAREELRMLVATELEHILASEFFRTSKQGERLLRYLVAQSLDDQEEYLRERAIGEKVFGRPPKYDSNADSIVRVWANHLRKRLAQYYLSDPRPSGIRFDMRPGSYRVEFHPVVAETPAEVPAKPASAPRTPFSRPSLTTLLGTLASALAVICGWLLWQNAQLRTRPAVAGPRPPLNLLWSRMSSQDQTTEIVLADSNLSLFQDILNRSVSLQDYLHHNYLLIPGDSPQKHALDLIMNRRYTSTADVDILRRTLPLAEMEHGRIDPVFARDFSADDLKKRNVILVGSRRSNPWVEPFEPQMHFRFEYDDARKIGSLVNVHPLAGEPATFTTQRPVEEMSESFGLLAFMPNLEHTGNVLIVAGLSMQGTLACGELVTNADLFRQVVDLFQVKSGAPLPYFEIVLKAEMIGNTVHSFKIVASRRLE